CRGSKPGDRNRRPKKHPAWIEDQVLRASPSAVFVRDAVFVRMQIYTRPPSIKRKDSRATQTTSTTGSGTLVIRTTRRVTTAALSRRRDRSPNSCREDATQATRPSSASETIRHKFSSSKLQGREASLPALRTIRESLREADTRCERCLR